MSNSLVRSTEPSPCDWADSLIPTTLEMSDDAIGIANKGSVVEWKTAHGAPPGASQLEKRRGKDKLMLTRFFQKSR